MLRAVMLVSSHFARAFAFLLLAAPPLTVGADDQNELSRQATDPTASLMALNFQGLWVGDYYGPNPPGQPDDQFTFQFRPVIPFEAFGKPNIFRATIPYQLDGRGDEGFKPISLFDLVVFNEDWGRWGLGPVASIDTTGDLVDPFAIGPAVGFVKQESKRFNWGLFSQNVFWSDTAVTNLQPVIAYQLGDGWSLSAGDLQFSYDWQDGRWLNLPIGFQIGKVARIGSQPMRFAVNPQYNLADDDFFPEWSVTFTITALFPSP